MALVGLIALIVAAEAAYWIHVMRVSRNDAAPPPSSSAHTERSAAPSSASASALAAERARGAGLYAQGRFAEAVEAYEHALEHGDDAQTRAQLAQALEALRRFDEAGEQYRRALSLDAHDGAAWYDYGNLLRSHMKDYRGAIDAYRRAIDERPLLAEAHFALGAVLLDIGEPDDAAASIESSLSLAPPDASWRPDAEEALLVARTRAAQRALRKPK